MSESTPVFACSFTYSEEVTYSVSMKENEEVHFFLVGFGRESPTGLFENKYFDASLHEKRLMESKTGIPSES